MALTGSVTSATVGQRGFDTASQVTQATLQAAKEGGYAFAIRYVRRVPATVDPGVETSSLTASEAQMILEAGLALMAVQYVESADSWMPSGEKGTQNGQTGAAYAQQIGLPAGINLWCDLEGVSSSAAWTDVDAYCRNWYAAVEAAGYVPGLYVGWSPGLDPQQLEDLPFQHYWRSYNLNADQVPATRGTQMSQEPQPNTLPGVDPGSFDEDVVTGDRLGGVPMWLSPAG